MTAISVLALVISVVSLLLAARAFLLHRLVAYPELWAQAMQDGATVRGTLHFAKGSLEARDVQVYIRLQDWILRYQVDVVGPATSTTPFAPDMIASARPIPGTPLPSFPDWAAPYMESAMDGAVVVGWLDPDGDRQWWARRLKGTRDWPPQDELPHRGPQLPWWRGLWKSVTPKSLA